MLVITRRPVESFFIGGKIEVIVLQSSEGKVRVGINAPREVEIVRTELIPPEDLSKKTAEYQHWMQGG